MTSKEIEPIAHIYDKVLAHMIMKTEKFYQSAMCKLEYRKDGGVIPRLESQRDNSVDSLQSRSEDLTIRSAEGRPVSQLRQAESKFHLPSLFFFWYYDTQWIG